MTNPPTSHAPRDGTREPGTRRDGEAMPPGVLDPENAQEPQSAPQTADFGAEVDPDERQRREDELIRNDEGF